MQDFSAKTGRLCNPAFLLVISLIRVNCLCVTDVLAGELSSVLTAGLSGLGATDDSYNFATDFL